jgi:peptidyl-prolyl cis-trans isomerase SurA
MAGTVRRKARAWVRATRMLGALGAVLAVAGPVRADREVVDRVVAMVDDEAILLSDVVREMNLARLQRNLDKLDAKQQEALFRQVLDGMINDQLLVAEAKQKGFEVGEQELNDAVEEQIRGIKDRLGGEERYREELAKQGFTEAEVRDMHREQRRKQILASRVIQSELRSKISITGDQVRSVWETQRDSIPPELLHTSTRVHLADILVTPRVDEKRMQEARAKINLALARLEKGEDFATVAAEVSEWPTAKAGGLLGKFRYGDFESDSFDDAVRKLEPGETSGILETKYGLMVVKLESRDGDVMTARHIVIKTEIDENAKVAALEHALELRRRVLAGESFEDLARRYSDDPLTKDKGGLVEEEWSVEDLRPEFRGAIDSTRVGEVSSVVSTTNGYYLFKILERTDSHATTLDEVREPLTRFLEQRELERRYRTYVAELRKKFYVDVKV